MPGNPVPVGRPARRGHRRQAARPSRRDVLLGLGLLGLTVGGVSYTERGTGRSPLRDAGRRPSAPPAAPAVRAVAESPAPTEPPPATPTAPAPAGIAGLGPATMARIPAATRQVVVATGADTESAATTVRLWSCDPAGDWRPVGTAWPAHNGRRGWTEQHRAGDLRSPIGVFTLTDAGGLRPNPGTALPYHRSSGFDIDGSGFEGEPLEGAFDYVVAIDYNRVPGRSPLDPSHPLGAARGGGIWLHVDHGGPTHGCVTLTGRDLVALMTALAPNAHPVIVMGPGTALAI